VATVAKTTVAQARRDDIARALAHIEDAEQELREARTMLRDIFEAEALLGVPAEHEEAVA
jgi:hypothetical protein